MRPVPLAEVYRETETDRGGAAAAGRARRAPPAPRRRALMADDKLGELAKAGVTRVRVHYTDLIGTTRAKAIPLEVLEEACEDGLNFCVSVFAIDHTGVMPDGTGIRDEVNFRDMQVVPDLETLRIVPWERETAICLADCRLDDEPLETDPRNILRRAIAAAEAKGLQISVGPRARVLPPALDPGGPARAVPADARACLPDGRAHRSGRRRSRDGGQRPRARPSLRLREPRVRPLAVGDQHALRGRPHGGRRGAPPQARDQGDRRDSTASSPPSSAGRPRAEGRPATTSTSRPGTATGTPSTIRTASSGSPSRPGGSWAASSRTRAG